MIEWLKNILDLIQDGKNIELVVHNERTDLLICELITFQKLTEKAFGIKRYLILGIDCFESEIDYSILNEFCLKYNGLMGVAQYTLVTNGKTGLQSNNLIDESNIKKITIQGKEFGEIDKKVVENLSLVLLGGLDVDQYYQKIRESEINIDLNKLSIEEKIEIAYSQILFAYIEELELLKNESGKTIFTSQNGEQSFLGKAYASVVHPVGDNDLTFFIPDFGHYKKILNNTLIAYYILNNITSTSQEHIEKINLLNESYIDLHLHALNWINGASFNLKLEETRALFKKFIEYRYLQIFLSKSAGDNQKQLGMLSLISLLDANDAVEYITKILKESGNVTILEKCLETIYSLNLELPKEDLKEFLLAPRKQMRVNALKILSNSKSEDTAQFLIQLLTDGEISLDLDYIEAIARTQTLTALHFLCNMYVHSGCKEPEFIRNAEVCLENVKQDDCIENVDSFSSIFSNEILMKIINEKDISIKRFIIKFIAKFNLDKFKHDFKTLLLSKEILLRKYVIESIPLFAKPDIINEMILSLNKKPDDYQKQKLMSWIESYNRVSWGQDNNYGSIRSIDELDLDKICRKVLLILEKQKLVDSNNINITHGIISETEVPSNTDNDINSKWMLENINSKHLIYIINEQLSIWLNFMSPKEEDGQIMVGIIHNNQFGDKISSAEFESMLSGGLSITMGSATEIFEGIVYKYKKGEPPIFPVSAAMGEVKTLKTNNGKTTFTN